MRYGTISTKEVYPEWRPVSLLALQVRNWLGADVMSVYVKTYRGGKYMNPERNVSVSEMWRSRCPLISGSSGRLARTGASLAREGPGAGYLMTGLDVPGIRADE
jgi:hypothetical protein